MLKICDKYKTSEELKAQLTEIDELHYLLSTLLEYLFAPEEKYLHL